MRPSQFVSLLEEYSAQYCRVLVQHIVARLEAVISEFPAVDGSVSVKARFLRRGRPGSGFYIQASWEGSPHHVELLVIPDEENDGFRIRIGDVDVPPSLRGNGLMTRVIKFISEMDANGEITNQGELGVHVPTEPDKWRTLIRRGGMDPIF